MVLFPRDNNEETKNSSCARVFTSADRSPLVVIPHAGGRRQVPTLLGVKSVASICRRINQRTGRVCWCFEHFCVCSHLHFIRSHVNDMCSRFRESDLFVVKTKY